MQVYKPKNSEGGILCLKENGIPVGIVEDEAGEEGGQ